MSRHVNDYASATARPFDVERPASDGTTASQRGIPPLSLSRHVNSDRYASSRAPARAGAAVPTLSLRAWPLAARLSYGSDQLYS